jgi:DNA-binding MarR family transcriptional regulator
MRDLSQPDQLAQHLEENASAWGRIVGAFDPRALGLFGRFEALGRSHAELQRRALSPHGLNYAEFTTIGMLRTSPPDFRRSPSELRRLVGQTSAGMTRILAKLEDEGLVRRASHARDGRRVDVLLTARGRALAEASFESLLAAQADLLAPLGKRRRDELLRTLDELLEIFAGVRPQRASRATAPTRGTRAAAGRRGTAGSPG